MSFFFSILYTVSLQFPSELGTYCKFALLDVSRRGTANKDRRFSGALLIKDEQSGDLPRQDTASCPWRDCRESPVSDAGPPTPSLAIPL